MLQQNLIISLPTYPKFCWYATGTTHIFHLGLNKVGMSNRHKKLFANHLLASLYIISRDMRFLSMWYVGMCEPAKAQTSLHILAV